MLTWLKTVERIVSSKLLPPPLQLLPGPIGARAAGPSPWYKEIRDRSYFHWAALFRHLGKFWVSIRLDVRYSTAHLVEHRVGEACRPCLPQGNGKPFSLWKTRGGRLFGKLTSKTEILAKEDKQSLGDNESVS